MPSLYIIGGANGSGKTTVSMSLLPNTWENYPGAKPDWSGHEGFFKNLDEVDKFIGGLHKINHKSV